MYDVQIDEKNRRPNRGWIGFGFFSWTTDHRQRWRIASKLASGCAGRSDVSVALGAGSWRRWASSTRRSLHRFFQRYSFLDWVTVMPLKTHWQRLFEPHSNAWTVLNIEDLAFGIGYLESPSTRQPICTASGPVHHVRYRTSRAWLLRFGKNRKHQMSRRKGRNTLKKSRTRSNRFWRGSMNVIEGQLN